MFNRLTAPHPKKQLFLSSFIRGLYIADGEEPEEVEATNFSLTVSSLKGGRHVETEDAYYNEKQPYYKAFNDAIDDANNRFKALSKGDSVTIDFDWNGAKGTYGMAIWKSLVKE
jgi:hypothetical protein